MQPVGDNATNVAAESRFTSQAFKPAQTGSLIHLPLERKHYLRRSTTVEELPFSFTDVFHVMEGTTLTMSSTPAAATRDNHTSSPFWHKDGLWRSTLLG